jgi:hypothetical protein
MRITGKQHLKYLTIMCDDKLFNFSKRIVEMPSKNLYRIGYDRETIYRRTFVISY